MNLDLVQTAHAVSQVAAVLSPLAVAYVTKQSWPSEVKTLLNLAFTTLATVLATAIVAPGQSLSSYVTAVLQAFAVAFVAHIAWSKLGVTEKVARRGVTDAGGSEPPDDPPPALAEGGLIAGSALTGTFLRTDDPPRRIVLSRDDMTVRNPPPEPASESLAAAVLKGIRDDTDRSSLPEPVPYGKLGKLGKPRDTRDFKLARWIDRANLPRIPSSGGWDDAVLNSSSRYTMLLNNRLGDCVPTMVLHAIQTWIANTGGVFTPQDSDALTAYERIGGYNPLDPSTDQGCVERDALNVWRKTGVAGHKIDGYGAIKPTDRDLVKIGIHLLGVVMFGFNLPVSVQGKDHWSVGRGRNAEPGSWGGHAVPGVAYDSRHLWVVTWPDEEMQVLPVTWSFVERYADEAWGAVSKDWLNSGAVSPSGFNEAQLNADLRQLAA